MLRLGLQRVRFDARAGRAALEDGATAATDVAEALAQKGIPFRTAYKLTGALVRSCADRGIALSRVPVDMAREIDPRFDEQVLKAADAAAAVARKRNAGGPGPGSIEAQMAALRTAARAPAIPRLVELFEELKEAAL
jgi:argininosuccinate lyase